MKEYKIVSDLMLEELQKVNEELGQNQYRNCFRKVTNTEDDRSREERKIKEKDEKKKIKDFYDSCQKLKNLENNSHKG